ncbi:MAG TPA: hypothetical protein VMR41_01640, partial [Patescibacteria group bacterium]|nr:hypothetical protein [Patescibacteria group bacterium]
MKYKSLKFLFVVALLAIVGAVVSFKVNISLKPNTALASGPTCSDGAATCGSFGGYMVPGSISCSINGRMNNGQTATCNTADGTTVIGGPGQQEWLVLNKTGSVVVPSTLPAPDANYNSTTVFSNTAINIDWGANQAGTVHIGTAYDSYDPCSPYAIGKIGCNGFSGEISPNGTANPGDVLSMTVTALHADNNMNSTCTPGTNCGQWGAGTASVALSDITYCFKSSSPSNNNYIIPGNSSSGKRNYVTTADGVCTPNNVPVAVPTLTAHWNSGTSTTTTDNVTVGQPYTGNFVFSNSGQAGSSVTVTGCDVIKSDSTFNTSFPPCSGTYSAGGSGGSASITVTSPSSGTPNVQVVVHGVDTANANSTFSQTLTLNITAPVTPPSGTISISNPSSLSCSAPCSPTIQWSSSHVVNGVQIFRGPTFWGNQAGNTSSSSTDYGPGNLGLSAGSYQYCIFAVDASWNDVTPALMCTTLTVTAPTTYTVSTSAGAGGSISPSSQTVNSGQTTTFTVTPLTNYSISSVSGCNGSLSSSIYTTGAIIANCTVTASFSSSATLPTVTTSSISNIGQTTATGGGTITSNGGATVTVSGIVWSNTTTYPTTTNYLGITYDGWSIGGPWIDNISGLKANTSYYVRAYATNSVGTAYDGSYVPFTTIAAAPTTYTVSTSAGAGGSISPSSQTVNSGSTTILTVFPNSGYNTSSASGCGGSLSGNTYYTGAITANCTVTASFTASTTLPNVTTSSISNIGQTTATGGGTINSNGGATVTQSGIVWSNTTSSPTTSNYSGINTYGYAIGGPWSDVMTGLTAGTTYYVRAYATNSVGTAYGNYVSFTTTAAPPTTYTVTPSAGYGGSISPGTQQTVNSGSSLTFNINPSSGYSISNVLVDSSPV